MAPLWLQFPFFLLMLLKMKKKKALHFVTTANGRSKRKQLSPSLSISLLSHFSILIWLCHTLIEYFCAHTHPNGL